MYKDRGIIKWAPFDTLKNFHEKVELLKLDRLKEDKPVLSSDQLDKIDQSIRYCFEFKKSLLVYYVNDGFINSIHDSISRIDVNEKKILFDSGLELKMDLIIDVEEN